MTPNRDVRVASPLSYGSYPYTILPSGIFSNSSENPTNRKRDWIIFSST
jgi:hypothetical protein